MCLLWAILAFLYPPPPGKNLYRPGSYPDPKTVLNLEGIDFPTPISQITKIEKQNSLAINVYGWEKNSPVVYRISEQPENIKRINILMITENDKFHYVWIKYFSRFVYTQSKHQHRKYFCERCLHGFSREDLLTTHVPECKGIGGAAVKVEMPQKGKNILSFINHHKQLPVPYVIYADFEALTRKIEGPQLDPTQSNTQNTHLHETCSYCYIVVRCDGKVFKPVEYRGPNTTENFLKDLQREEERIKKRNILYCNSYENDKARYTDF